MVSLMKFVLEQIGCRERPVVGSSFDEGLIVYKVAHSERFADSETVGDTYLKVREQFGTDAKVP